MLVQEKSTGLSMIPQHSSERSIFLGVRTSSYFLSSTSQALKVKGKIPGSVLFDSSSSALDLIIYM